MTNIGSSHARHAAACDMHHSFYENRRYFTDKDGRHRFERATYQGNYQRRCVPAGRCQATEACGYQCLRLSQSCPPYHLCEHHCRCTNTLPRGLMNLPTELRIEIFTQLFQKAHKNCKNELHCWPYPSMPAYSTPTFSMSHPGPEYALLGVNQQLRNEAEYALFTSTTSVAQVGALSIRFLNKSWLSADWDRFQQRLYCSSSACNLPVTMAKRIRNIKIHIGLGAYGMGSRDRLGKLTVQNHTEEDAGLYAVRANVRKLVDMISCTDANGKQVHSLRNLTITVHGNSTTYSWP
jgi:hypothetical protein